VIWYLSTKSKQSVFRGSSTGVANLFGKRAKFMIKEVHRAKSWFKGTLAGQVFSSFTANLCANFLSELVKKSPWAISKALAGKKWPAGPALATPGLYRPVVANLFGKRAIIWNKKARRAKILI
jgi:hypothetical protein